MNKQLAFILIAAIATLGLGAVVVLMILVPDQADKFMDYLVNLLVIVAGFGGLAYGQAKQDQKIDTIKANTNGTLTRKDDEIATYRAALAEQAPEALALIDSGAVEVVRKE